MKKQTNILSRSQVIFMLILNIFSYLIQVRQYKDNDDNYDIYVFCILYQLSYIKLFTSNFIKLIQLLHNQSQPFNQSMQAYPQKQSIYSIEPWKEQASTIPNQFLNTKKFGKTTFIPKSSQRSAKKLQIVTNSVYLIKNLHENEVSPPRSRMKIHRTAQNSPKMRQQDSSKILLRRGLSDRIINSHQIATFCQKKREQEMEANQKFLETKQTFIEFKVINKNKQKIGQRQFQSKTGEAKSNLLKKYQRSISTRQGNKREGRYEEGLDQTNLRKKLRTEKSTYRQESIKNLLIFSQDPEEIKIKIPIKIEDSEKKIVSKQSQILKDNQNNEKLKIQLLMERKLFLMKNNLNKWHKKTDNYGLSNRVNK